MKPLILKKMTPFAVVVLGIVGAFGTTSMQSAKADIAPVIGYVSIPGDPCSVEVECSDSGDDTCRLFYPSGPEAKALDPDSETTCAQQLYRP
ncbi:MULTISPECIES: DUF6520 family protein [unclassified Flavobacterium]|uniref:DUF6520 family protein n=1 Tax=unclassified Flavobacterium TaxID=196869 RepID=UPI0006ABD1A3|nr:MULTISPECIES: DUF6520 family protein [unclassified Flavobacterium]KOP38914.1 hypothetical protein AKO67_07805 [Flavobacterium sp. VMW]OWU92865.1 hypothetical protein APR43_02065 [Flavobacterium sp. NLM]